MKLESLEIENVRSFKDLTKVTFESGFNLLIGPNAGGKSNLMDVLSIVVNRHLVQHWIVENSSRPPGKIVVKRVDAHEPILSYLDRHVEKPDDQSYIKIALRATTEDASNIRAIFSNMDALADKEQAEYGTQYIKEMSLPEGFVIDRMIGQVFEYEITDVTNLRIVENPDGTTNQEAHVFLKYLNQLGLAVLLIADLPELDLPSPIQQPYLYFSPYRSTTAQELLIQISDKNEFDLLSAYKKNTSRDTSSLMTYASFMIGSFFRKTGDNHEKFGELPAVINLRRYLVGLGFDNLSLRTIDPNRNIYSIVITRNRKNFDIAKASSGEKEIINILFGVFIFNVKNGLIVIDEPELHLHPRWQKKLNSIFLGLSRERDLQVIAATHSSQFITHENINSIIRVYKDRGGNKTLICKPNPSALPESTKDVFQVINSLNNEKLFFADQIILVEGIDDRIIYGKALDLLKRTDELGEVVEVIEVGGKGNFEKFHNFLEAWDIKHSVIADSDYDGNIPNVFKHPSTLEGSFSGISKFNIEKAIEQSMLIDSLETLRTDFRDIHDLVKEALVV
ncbi:MAG: AAA family ATPase [Candidatus Colwellbacteria bacterium]